MALNNGDIAEEEHRLLEKFVEYYESKLKCHWVQTFFLNCNIDTCYERVQERARVNERLCRNDIEALGKEYENIKDKSSITLSANGTIYGLENMLLNELNL